MRRKRDTQGWLGFQESTLQVTNQYFAKYEGISSWLDKSPEILDLAHRDTRAALTSVSPAERSRRGHFKYTSEHVLRLCIAQIVEGVSLRGIVVRVDDSRYLRVFTRIFDGPMMDFTTLDRAPRRAGQKRPVVGGSKPASGESPETRDHSAMTRRSFKPLPRWVRQLLGPHLTTWA